MATKPDDQVDKLGAILENLVRYIERGEHNGRPIHFIGEYKQQLDQYYADFYRNKIPTPPRQASELYPQDYVDGYTQAVDDITAQFNSNDKPSAPEGSVCVECGVPAHWLYDNEPLCKPHWYATERVNE